jgi:hypothetical protein
MIHVGHRFDVLVDPLVDADEIGPRLVGQHDIARRARRDLAFESVLGTKLDPADRRAGDVAGGDIEQLARHDGLRSHPGREDCRPAGNKYPLVFGSHNQSPSAVLGLL